MPNGLKVKVENAGVLSMMRRLRAAFSDLRAPLTNAARRLSKNTRARFDSKTDPDGHAWAPWSPKTAAEAKKTPGRKLMVHTGALRDRSRFIPGRKDIRAVIGTPYGVFHEQPQGKGRGHVPRRAFLFSTRNGGRALALDDEAYLLNAIRYQIRKAAKQ